MVPVGDTELLFSLSTCTCNFCGNFEYTKCQMDKVHGKWVEHCILKKASSEPDEIDYDSCVDDDKVEYNVTEDELSSADDEIEENEGITDIVKFDSVHFSLSEFLIVKVSEKQYICEGI